MTGSGMRNDLNWSRADGAAEARKTQLWTFAPLPLLLNFRRSFMWSDGS
jgi:hypothetical protein